MSVRERVQKIVRIELPSERGCERQRIFWTRDANEYGEIVFF